jgi:hypothetical protein
MDEKKERIAIKARKLPHQDENKSAFEDEQTQLGIHLAFYGLKRPLTLGVKTNKKNEVPEVLWLAEDRITFGKNRSARVYDPARAAAIFGTQGHLIKLYSINCKKWFACRELLVSPVAGPPTRSLC